MQPEKLTIKAQEAVAHAQQLAQQREHAEVQPLHLLAALLEETDGVVRPLLQKLGADEGYDPSYGARPLKRVIQQRIENALAGRILTGDFSQGQTVRVDSDPTKHDFKFSIGKTVIAGEGVE